MRTKEEMIKYGDELISRGYTKYNQELNSSDFQYMKTFKKDYIDDEKRYGYIIGVLVYDYSQFSRFASKECFSTSYYMLLGNSIKIDRFDIDISDKKMTIEDFEELCDVLYNSDCFKKYR